MKVFMNSRRLFLKFFTTFPFLSFLSYISYGKSKCGTGSDATGPFYRKKAPQRTNLASASGYSGDTLIVKGIVYGKDCRTPLVKAEVDIWHAGPNGQYDNYSSKFEFRGVVITDDQGHYEYKTLLPGIYGSRPRHIHYKVRHSDYSELTTQLYFADDNRLMRESVSRSSNGIERAMPYAKQSDGRYHMQFDIYLA